MPVCLPGKFCFLYWQTLLMFKVDLSTVFLKTQFCLVKNEMIRGTERKQQVKNSSIYINYKWFGAKFMHYDIWLLCNHFFSLKMLTLPDINHNVPLCWLLVIGRKGVSSCATDTARLWRQASTRSTLLIPFNWILFINCFCFMGGGRGKGKYNA